jgi:ribosome-associated protein
MERDGGGSINAIETARIARAACEDKKAVDIRLLDVTGISDLADYILIVSGSAAPHLKAIAREIEHRLKEKGTQCRHKSGDAECGWIVIDCLDVVIHAFLPRMRQYYSLEELWSRAPEVP